MKGASPSMHQATSPVLLAVEGINAYYGESHILRNVSFTIEPGEVVCLMGRNGMGKTTTLKTLTGLLPARSGTIRFAGRDITQERTDRRAKQGLAYVPQGREIIPHLTVHQNLLLGYWNRPALPGDVPEPAAFEEVYQLCPKLTQILHRPGGVLSGGEQQQLAIGRAILSSPKLLLLDEPTEGIQPSIVDQIEDVIIGFKQSRRFAILLVEQGLHFAARLAEKYVIMAKGAVMAQGKSAELNADMVRQHLTV
jgi:urea transport system ATP-binding protein